MVNPVHDAAQLFEVARQLLRKAPIARPVRLLGISTSSFTDTPIQQITLESHEKNEKKERLNASLLELYHRYGNDIIQTGGELESQKILEDREHP